MKINKQHTLGPLWELKLGSEKAPNSGPGSRANLDRPIYKALGLKMAQDGPKMTQNRLEMVQNGPKMVPRWLDMTQHGPRWSQDGPKMCQNAAKMLQDVS